MFGKLIKLAVVAVVLHAAWRAGSAYWVYYHFEGVGESKNVRVATGLVVRF